MTSRTWDVIISYEKWPYVHYANQKEKRPVQRGCCHLGTCPVSLTERFLLVGQQGLPYQTWLLLLSATIDFLRATKLFKKQLKVIELDPKKYRLHGLRLVRASSAVDVAIQDRLLMRQGGCCSQTVFGNISQRLFRIKGLYLSIDAFIPFPISFTMWHSMSILFWIKAFTSVAFTSHGIWLKLQYCGYILELLNPITYP